MDNAYRSDANKLSRTVKNLTIKCNEQAFYGTSGQKCELFRGGGQGADTRENRRRDSPAGAREAREVVE